MKTYIQKINPFLWFDGQAEEAAKYYVSIFKDSKILKISRYGEAVPGAKGSVMTVSFQIEGQEFVALNAGPQFKFTEAISFVVNCDTQDEVDYYWNKLIEDGGSESQCGWLKDKFGLSWQITPAILIQYVTDEDSSKADRVMKVMMTMKKIEIKPLEEAYHNYQAT
ncbi:MAG: 3-demethylubiquinone-9 3-methyltransferase [Daejeonella sp.]|nr:3-demethylubiquinone-9 3-methyltransferase [Daejeonella sp.]